MAAAGRVLGDYLLGARIGGGGMSDVFAAERRAGGSAVAVKVLRPHFAADEAQAARFLAEATRTRAIVHPNVVRVLDGGRADDGTLYLVMELIDGEDLAARIKRVGRLDEAEVRRIGAAVADGMQAAHDRGIVHRDLKPANIRIGADGEPKIVDFGIAKLLAGDGGATGPAMGTPCYMAPEQLGDGAATPAVDVWALGVTLFEAATGSLPFTGFADGRCPQLVEPAPRPSERAPLSVGLETLILQCLKRNAGQRPASMRAIAERLRSDEERATAPLAAAVATATPPRARWAIRAAAAVVVLAIAAVAVWRVEHKTAPAPIAVKAPVAAATAVAAPAVAAPVVAATATPTPPTLAAPATVKPARTRHHAAHHVRSRVYGEKLD